MTTTEAYHPHQTKSTWSQAIVAQLIALWMQGKSASEIAVCLPGGYSRNAIIGKLHRLKLMAKTADRPPSKRRKKVPRHPVTRRPLPTVAPLMPRVIINAPPPPPPTPSGTLALVDLTERTCKWPIGEVGAPGFHFCGASKENRREVPYCAYHTLKARGRAS